MGEKVPFTGYLTEAEITEYCTIIDGVKLSDTKIASELINGYLGQTFEPREFTDKVKLSKKNRAKLSHHPVISVTKVVEVSQSMFGRSNAEVAADNLFLDPENDGYFSYEPGQSFADLFYKSVPSYLLVTYTSGFSPYPERLKQACAALASNIRQALSFNGAKQMTSLDFQILMTDDSFFTSDIKMLLKGLNNDVRSV